MKFTLKEAQEYFINFGEEIAKTTSFHPEFEFLWIKIYWNRIREKGRLPYNQFEIEKKYVIYNISNNTYISYSKEYVNHNKLFSMSDSFLLNDVFCYVQNYLHEWFEKDQIALKVDVQTSPKIVKDVLGPLAKGNIIPIIKEKGSEFVFYQNKNVQYHTRNWKEHVFKLKTLVANSNDLRLYSNYVIWKIINKMSRAKTYLLNDEKNNLEKIKKDNANKAYQITRDAKSFNNEYYNLVPITNYLNQMFSEIL